MENPKTVPDLLHEAANIYRLRSQIYGDNYKHFGKVMCALMPQGVSADAADEEERVSISNRFGVLVQIVSKLTRYCENFNKGGHDDSLQDLAVYATMLRELDAAAMKYNEIPF